MTSLNGKKIFLTDTERDLTYGGIVDYIIEKANNLEISLVDVKVYEYSSSNYLHYLPKLFIVRPKHFIFIEEAK